MSSEYKPVPVEVAADISRRFEKNIVLIFCHDLKFENFHMTTFGADGLDKINAAYYGDRIMEISETTAKMTFEDFRTTPAAESKARIDALEGVLLMVEAELEQVPLNYCTHLQTARSLLAAALKPERKDKGS